MSLLGRHKPEILFNHYVRLARRQGLRRAYFILSFDCDTDLDIEVVEEVHTRLAEIGIMPVYAVPGQLLERGKAVYRRLADQGAEFINHGYYTHTRYHSQTGAYESIFFYDQLPRETILDDIRRGHRACLEVVGQAPTGFRVPHFGTFQHPKHLKFLHKTLADMGYAYSTSTAPVYGFWRGPAQQVTTAAGTLHELPVSGCFDYPLRILDSWGFRYAPGRRLGEEDYLEQFDKAVCFFDHLGHCGLLNYYVDPSQVYDWPQFFEAIRRAAPLAIDSYSHFLRDLQQ